MMSKKHFLRHWLLILFLSIGVMVTSSQTASDDKPAVDILFIIDQSGSMCGIRCGAPSFWGDGTDPLDLRFLGVQFALSWLSNTRQFLPIDLEIALSAISFGTTAETTLPWTSLAPDDISPTDWAPIEAQLLETLSKDSFVQQFPSGSLGDNTNFQLAFELANTFFATRPVDHQRVIILLTDGEPCVTVGANAFQCGNPTAEQRHMDNLKAFAEQNFAQDDFIYVIALDDSGEIWLKREQDWQNITRIPERTSRIEDGAQIASRMQAILAEVIASTYTTLGVGTDDEVTRLLPLPLTGQDQFSVPPYQTALEIVIFKSTNQPVIGTLLMPNNMPANQLTVRGADTPIEIWRVEAPAPGTWSFTMDFTANNVVDATLQILPMEFDVTLSSGTGDLFTTVPLNATVNRRDGQAIPVYPDYPLFVDAKVSYPDGRERTFLMSGNDGVYTANWVIEQGGLHNLSLNLRTLDLDGSPLSLYRSHILTSINAGGISLGLDTPLAPHYLVDAQLALAATLTDSQGQATQLEALNITGELIPLGVGSPQTIDFVYDAVSRRYNGLLNLPTQGNYRFALRANRVSDDGALQTVLYAEMGDFEVRQGQLINLTIQAPLTGEYTITDGFPTFAPQSFQVILETALKGDDDNSPERINLQDYTLDGQLPLTLSLLRDGASVLQTTSFQQSDVGMYILTLPAFEEGSYTLLIQADSPLIEGYAIDNNAEARVLLTMIVHPLRYLTLIGGGLLALLTVLGGIFFVVRYRQSRQYPLKGILKITRKDGLDEPFYIKDIRLSQYNRNRVKLSYQDLGLRKNDKLDYIILECEDERMYKNQAMRLTVKHKTSKMRPTRLDPGSIVYINEDQDYSQGEMQPIIILELTSASQNLDSNGSFF